MRVSLAVMFQYRGEIILWAVWGVIYPAVAIAMWTAAIQGSSDGTQIAGYSARDFAAYFLMTMVVGHVCTAWDVYEMGYYIRSGNMSARLLRPLLPVWQNVGDNISYKVLTLAILIPLWLFAAWVTEPRFQTTTVHLLLGVPAMLLAAALSFLLGYVVAIGAFWITKMDAISEMWFALHLFFGGRIAPPSVLPWPLSSVASALPFQWMVWFPSEALTGRLTTEQMIAGIGWQLFWLVVAVVAFRLAWAAGVKKYSAVGA